MSEKPTSVIQHLVGAVVRQHEALPPDHPRRRPTLPRLRFLELDLDEPAVEPANLNSENDHA